MQAKIIEYITDCPRKKKVYYGDLGKFYSLPMPTITGLTLYLGFCDRSSFYKYEGDAEEIAEIEDEELKRIKQEFRHTVKKARAFIEREYEEMLQTGKPAGAIFALKNFGWKDERSYRVGELEIDPEEERLAEELVLDEMEMDD
jgi:hypothetical protein